MVRAEGLEPPKLAPLVPKTSVSTNFTTPAFTQVMLGRLYSKASGGIKENRTKVPIEIS